MVSRRQVRNVYPLGAVLACKRGSFVAHHAAPAGRHQPDEYVNLYKRFNPTQFDPAAWVRLAQEAGQRYMVFTTKHHDGFCMFDSSLTDYKITNTPYGKDVMAMLAKAAHDAGMPIGFYYSPPDMHNPDYRDTTRPVKDTWHG